MLQQALRRGKPRSRIRSDPRRTQADSADFFGVRLSPTESASADLLADWLADPIGSAADPPRTKSADYSPSKTVESGGEFCL